MARKERCVFCGEPATVLCDFILGFEIMGYSLCTGEAALNANRFEEFVPGKGLPYTGKGAECFTCDAPLCDGCAIHDGLMFFDGDKEHTAIKSVDRCPTHGKEWTKTTITITAEQAERVRFQTWRNRFRLVGRS